MSVFVVPKSELYLVHHGIPGQKKGRRRYQNEDGSLTALGRVHYGVGSTPLLEGPTRDSDSESSKSKTSSSKKKDKDYDYDAKDSDWDYVKDDDAMDGKWRKVDSGKKTSSGSNKKDVPSKSDAVGSTLSSVSKLSNALASRQQKKLAKDKQRVMKAIDVSQISTEDLKKAINRMSTEDTYKKMTAERVSYGRERTIKRLQTIGDLAAAGTSIVALYSAMNKIKKLRD